MTAIRSLQKRIHASRSWDAASLRIALSAAEAVANSDHGAVIPNFQYLLDGTPCAEVVGKHFGCYPSGVQALFPERVLTTLGAEGYAAIPLFDSSGRPCDPLHRLQRAPERGAHRRCGHPRAGAQAARHPRLPPAARGAAPELVV